MPIDFSSPSTERTPRVVNAAKLLRSAGRKKADRFLAEGENSVEAAVATGAATDLFVTEKAAERFEAIVTAAGHMGVFVHPITDRAAKSLSDTMTTTGIFAVCLPVLWSAREALKVIHHWCAWRSKLVSLVMQVRWFVWQTLWEQTA